MSWPNLPYSIPIYVPGGSTAKTNYAIVDFRVPWLRGMNLDFSDCRFNAADSTSLSYVREGYTSGSTSKFSILLPSHPTDGQIIYLFWGNASAADASDPGTVYARQITNCEGAWDARFGSSTSLPDRSGNGNDATVFADVTWDGKKFTGTSTSAKISIPDDSALNPGTDDWSLYVYGNPKTNTGTRYFLTKADSDDRYTIIISTAVSVGLKEGGVGTYAGAGSINTLASFVGTFDRDGHETLYQNGASKGSADISPYSGDISPVATLNLLTGQVEFYRGAVFRKVLTADERNDLSDSDKYPYVTPDIPNTINIVAARDDDIAPYFLESTFYTHDNRGFKPPFGARLKRDFPWPRWPAGFWVANNKAGDTLYDLSGRHNDGTIAGGTWENGRLKLDGAGNINVGTDGSLNITDAITIFALLHPTALATNHVIADNSDGTGGYKFEITTADVQRFAFTGNTAFAEAASSIGTYPNIIAVTCDSEAGRIYTNGALVAEATGQTGTASTVALKLLGGFVGYVDVVAVIPIALDSHLIKYLSAFPWTVLE